jgi:hypothetical protein
MLCAKRFALCYFISREARKVGGRGASLAELAEEVNKVLRRLLVVIGLLAFEHKKPNELNKLRQPRGIMTSSNRERARVLACRSLGAGRDKIRLPREEERMLR